MEKSRVTSITALLAATAASVCCVLPALLSILGFATAGTSLFGLTGFTFFAQNRLLFSALSSGMIGLSFYLAYRKPGSKDPECAGGTCTTSTINKSARRFTWIVAALTLVAIAYPVLAGGGTNVFLNQKENAAPTDERNNSQTAVIVAKGMDCEACANGIASTIETVPGVKSVRVDYPHAQFFIALDPKMVAPSAISDKITALGYPAQFVRTEVGR